MSKPLVISTEGPVGAGKSTMGAVLEKEVTEALPDDDVAVTIPENVDQFLPFLETFYNDPHVPIVDQVLSGDPELTPEQREKLTSALTEALGKLHAGRFAYEVQTAVFVSRVQNSIEKYNEALEKYGDRLKVVILERHAGSDRIFASLQVETMGKVMWEFYEKWAKMWEQLLPFEVSHHIYLRTPVDTCAARIIKRARECETNGGGKGVTEEYQAALLAAHDKYLRDPVRASQVYEVTRDDANAEVGSPGSNRLTSELVRWIISLV
jgi:deoxyadenosine/deoxycytidine kinase